MAGFAKFAKLSTSYKSISERNFNPAIIVLMHVFNNKNRIMFSIGSYMQLL